MYDAFTFFGYGLALKECCYEYWEMGYEDVERLMGRRWDYGAKALGLVMGQEILHPVLSLGQTTRKLHMFHEVT